MKTYSAAPDVEDVIRNMHYEHHFDLVQVTVGALFVFDLDEEHEPCLKHQGYPAAAVVRITPLKDRAMGIADAQIVVDRAYWISCTQPQKDALIDHELTHLNRVVSDKTGKPKFDALGRPKLAMRRHSHQLGWFVEVAERHGAASPEVRQAKQLIAQAGQMYFPFEFKPKTSQETAAEIQQRMRENLPEGVRDVEVRFNADTGEVGAPA